jgi:hypothetical protein
MTRLLKTLGVALALCAVAIPAATASASEFAADRGAETPCEEFVPCRIKGEGIGGERAQTLKFGAFLIKCNVKAGAKEVSEGAITWETSPVIMFGVKFSKCLTVAKFTGFTGGIPTAFNPGAGPMKITYHQNGYAQISGGSFRIGSKLCKISWPGQTIPIAAEKKPEEPYSSAVYSTKEVPVEEKFWKKFPSHFQKRLVITNEFKKMSWEYEEGQCIGEGGFEEEAKKTEGKEAEWLGALELKVTGGDLSFVP